MIGKLIYFEIMKKWRSAKYLLLGYLGIQALNLLITRIFLWNNKIGDAFIHSGTAPNNAGLPFILTTILFFILAIFLGAFPFIEGIYRFERDLSGRQSYLELMIPAVSWKKVLAKLAATLSSLIVCGTVSLFSMFMYVMANFNAQAIEFIGDIIEALSHDWFKVILVVLYMLFSCAASFMIIFFCITIAKSFTHKNRIAVPIGIAAFLIITGCTAALGIQLDKIPLMKFSLWEIETSLSRTLADIIVFLAAIAGTNWLMEKRIEH
jgi:hypothetical protein